MKLGVFGTSVMGLKLQVEIKQSREELEKAVKYKQKPTLKWAFVYLILSFVYHHQF